MTTDDQLISRNILKLAAGGSRRILEGEQKSTTRLGIRRYVLGQALLTEGRKRIHVYITMLEALTFGELSLVHARTEGFDSVAKLWAKIERHYPDIRFEDEITYVRFELVWQAPIETIQGGQRGRNND